MQIPTQMLSQSHFLSPNKTPLFSLSTNPSISLHINRKNPKFSPIFPISRLPVHNLNSVMTSKSALSNGVETFLGFDFDDSELDRFAVVGNKLADAAGEVIRKYFRKSFDVVDKEDLSPVTIADQEAEASMTLILQEHFPNHPIFGEENGWRCKEKFADYVWVLDPIDGTKSFITGKPLFGTLISLLYRGKPDELAILLCIRLAPRVGNTPAALRKVARKGKFPLSIGTNTHTHTHTHIRQAIMCKHDISVNTCQTIFLIISIRATIFGIIDQPILRERWIGIVGRKTTLNGQEVSTRKCAKLSQAYLYTTSPHLFSGDAEVAFTKVRNKVKVPLYGCDCYAYALLASGFVDLVIESGLKPYDFLSLIPVIEGAGGVITDWNGRNLNWEASSDSRAPSFNVVAAGDKELHQQMLDSLKLH